MRLATLINPRAHTCSTIRSNGSGTDDAAPAALSDHLIRRDDVRIHQTEYVDPDLILNKSSTDVNDTGSRSNDRLQLTLACTPATASPA